MTQPAREGRRSIVPAKKGSTRDKLVTYRRKRDFAKTAEPKGTSRPTRRKALRFVIQKHAATSLHFDFRLELDGVMKSWAVPKGPSYDTSVKRLAMEVEDHPIEYNTFEGTIPKGEYGGGTVMLWDRGTYTSPSGSVDDLRAGYERGDLKVELKGKRMHGGWVLVRIRRDEPGKRQWLLIKHRDEWADAKHDVVADEVTSVTTGRTMQEITDGSRAVWHSNRQAAKATRRGTPARASRRKPPAPRRRPSKRSRS
jgi:bifunctional non-homologous end joining protein LigD